MSQLDSIIFKNKKFSDVLEEIYNNQKAKQSQVLNLISQLKDLVEDTNDASLLVPLIKDYLDISVKNDDNLIKMANLVQRILQNQTSDDGYEMTDAEKEELLLRASQLTENKNSNGKDKI